LQSFVSRGAQFLLRFAYATGLRISEQAQVPVGDLRQQASGGKLRRNSSGVCGLKMSFEIRLISTTH
jgi:site-specific recombinase XerD